MRMELWLELPLSCELSRPVRGSCGASMRLFVKPPAYGNPRNVPTRGRKPCQTRFEDGLHFRPTQSPRAFAVTNNGYVISGGSGPSPVSPGAQEQGHGKAAGPGLSNMGTLDRWEVDKRRGNFA